MKATPPKPVVVDPVPVQAAPPPPSLMAPVQMKTAAVPIPGTFTGLAPRRTGSRHGWVWIRQGRRHRSGHRRQVRWRCDAPRQRCDESDDSSGSIRSTPDAMRAKVQGVVELEAVVGPNGVITEIRVLKSLDRAFGLDEEAIKTAKQWLFRPGRFQGQNVPVVVVIQMEFRLH